MVDYDNVELPRNPAVAPSSTNGVIIQRRSSVIKEVPRYETEDAMSENNWHEGDNTPQAPRESQSEGTKARSRWKRKMRVENTTGNEDWDQIDDGYDDWKLEEKKRHKCPNCYMRFKKPSALVIHMRTHSGEKPYTCKQCTKRFSISGNLRRHMFTHTGEKPYKCQACGRAFNNPSHLARHSKKIHI